MTSHFLTFLNRFFHFCAFCAFARTSFHSTFFVRFQTYLTKWCRESSFSLNSFNSDVIIMRLIKISDVHDKQFMFKQKMNDKMIEWWKKKKMTKKCYFMFKIIRSYFYMRRVYSFFSDHWFTFSTYHFRATSFSYIVFDKQREFLSSFIWSRQTYEFDKLIDEHVSYSSLDNEKSFC
jgi:hypothetical protein